MRRKSVKQVKLWNGFPPETCGNDRFFVKESTSTSCGNDRYICGRLNNFFSRSKHAGSGFSLHPTPYTLHPVFSLAACCLLLAACVILFSPVPARAAALDSFELIRRAYDEGRITADEAALYYTYKIKDPAKLPEEFRGDTPSRGATIALLWIKKHWEEFSPETRSELSGYPLALFGRTGARTAASRPELSDEQTYSSTHFMFHYTMKSGDVDAVSSLDFVTMMAAEFEKVWSHETGTLAYSRPPDDGDGKFDVYLGDLYSYGIYGMSVPETTVGDNPNSQDYTETDASTSFMIMDNDYKDYYGSALSNIQGTAAHEFFHCIQMGYNSAEEPWLFESTASWVEDSVYDSLDINYEYLPSWFESPDLGLSSDVGGNWYGSWIFFKFVTEHAGDASTVRRVWEKSRTHNSNNGDYSFQSLSEALTEKGTSFDTTFSNFAIANHIMEPPGSGHSYTYEEANDYISYAGSYPPVKIEGTINFTGSTKSYTSSSDGNGRLNGPSADYIEIDGGSPLKIEFNGDNSAKFAVKLITKKSGTGYAIEGMSLNSSGDGLIDKIAASDYSELVLVVINLGTTGSSAQYTLTVSATIIDVDPPVQAGWNPAKGASITTTTPAITFGLDENGDCKWSLSDLAYSAMTGDCDGDGTKVQSCAVSGMAEGGDSVYIACRDSYGNEDTAATNEEISYTISLFSLQLKQGWNLIGVSRTDASMLPAAASMEVTYFAKQGDYGFESSQNSIVLNFAGAYWIYSNSAAVQKVSGKDCIGNTCEDVTLHPGWSAFSVPYSSAVDWADSKSSVYCGGVKLNLPKVYEYDTDLKEYRAIEPNAGGTLDPWRGFWIYLDKNLTEPCFISLKK